MSVARPHRPDASGRGPEAPDGSTETGRPKTPPPPAPSPSSPLNSRAVAASNSKQARIKEAEEDRVLIARAQSGDMAAFRQLVERHQRRAFAIALSLVRDENDA